MTDNVLRVARNENFKTINLHAVANDSDLSAKATGLLVYLVTRPDGWKFYKSDIIKRFADGRTSIQSGLEELKGAGYLSIERHRSENGTFSGWCWTIREVPGDSPKTQNPNFGESEVGEPTPSSKDVSSENGSTQNSRRAKGDEREPGEVVSHGDDATPLRQLADTDPDENGRLTRALTAAWVSLQPERPSESEIRKQGAVAKRLAKDHTPRRLALALYGMDRLFPHSDGEPWDLFDFERKFSKAASKGAEAAQGGEGAKRKRNLADEIRRRRAQ